MQTSMTVLHDAWLQWTQSQSRFCSCGSFPEWSSFCRSIQLPVEDYRKNYLPEPFSSCARFNTTRLPWFCYLCWLPALPLYTWIRHTYDVFVSLSIHSFIPYFPGLLGMYCLNGTRPRYVSNCSSTVTFSSGTNASWSVDSHMSNTFRIRLVLCKVWGNSGVTVSTSHHWKPQESSMWRWFHIAGQCNTGQGFALPGCSGGASVWGVGLAGCRFLCAGEYLALLIEHEWSGPQHPAQGVLRFRGSCMSMTWRAQVSKVKVKSKLV